MVGAVIVIGYFMSSKAKERKFALRRESIILRSQNLDCDPEYLKELEQFERCMPSKCGRFVSDNIVTVDEAEQLLSLAKSGLAHGGSSGGASILDLHSGALSKGKDFVNIYKIPEAKGFLEPNAMNTYRVS